ncbi:MAG TPA: aspartate aminotransferase family protein [Planctomycetota bacterium]|nr:aspartate aminotransferase family protein [Planctomycetota bacterium]
MSNTPAGEPANPMKGLLDEVARRYADCHDLFAAHVNPRIVRVLRLMGFDEPFVEARGCYLQGRGGKRYLDFHSGEGATSLGYNHPEVTHFLTAIMGRGLPNMIQLNCNVLAGLLAERLLAKAPKYLSKVYFTSSGGETVDSALKFARCATGRNRILYCRQSFHGLTLGALSICGDEEFKEGFGTPLAHTTQIEFNDLARLQAELKRGDVAAFITEPIQGREVRVADRDFLANAGRLCRENGALFILDEIQTGLGRTGTFFALEQFDAEPDLLLVAKALSGGLVPVGAVLMRERIFASVYSSLERCYVHHSTYGYNTLAMAAGLATMDVIERRGLVANSQAMGAKIRSGLEQLKARHSLVADVRGKGLMFAIELGEAKGFINKVKWGVIKRMSRGLMPQMVVIPLFQDHGILSMVSGLNNVIKFIPPLIIGDAEVDYFLKALDQVLTQCETTSRPQELIFDLARRAVVL